MGLFNKHPLGNSEAGGPRTIFWEISLHIVVFEGLTQKHTTMGKMPHLAQWERRSTFAWRVRTASWVNLPEYKSSHVTFRFIILRWCPTAQGREPKAWVEHRCPRMNGPSSLALPLTSVLKPYLIVTLNYMPSAASYNFMKLLKFKAYRKGLLLIAN